MNNKKADSQQEIINSVTDMYSNAGKGLNKAKRFLKKKFNITVSQRDLMRVIDKLKKNREQAT